MAPLPGSDARAGSGAAALPGPALMIAAVLQMPTPFCSQCIGA